MFSSEQGRIVGDYQAGMTQVYIRLYMCESIVQCVQERAFVPVVIVCVGVGQRLDLGMTVEGTEEEISAQQADCPGWEFKPGRKEMQTG